MDRCRRTYSDNRCSNITRKPFGSNPDITGLGVLAAFAATAFLTFGAIVLGYLTNSLQENSLSDLDHEVIERVVNSRIGLISTRLWNGFVRMSRKVLFLKPPKEGDSLNTDQRRKALDKFILTLSDQQLVTGIAILVACYGNWCSTTSFDLSMVVWLAWFSATTHLSTLAILQHYFQDNRVVRNWRMTGMVTIVLLLIAGLFLDASLAGSEALMPIGCLKYITTINYWSELLPGRILAVVFLLYGYVTGILGTIKVSRKSSLTLSHIAVLSVSKLIVSWSANVSMEVIDNVMIENNKARIKKRSKKLSQCRRSKIFRQLYHICTMYSESFLFRIGGFSFALSYGVFQIALHRFSGPLSIAQNGDNRASFGQIVPLILLILPFIAALEIFHENDDKEVKEMSSQITGTPTSENEPVHDNSTESLRCGSPTGAASVSQGRTESCEAATTTTRNSDKFPCRTVGLIFLIHIAFSVTVGVLLNLAYDSSVEIVFAVVPAGIFLALQFLRYASNMFRILEIILYAARTNTLENNSNHSHGSNSATELPSINAGLTSPNSGGPELGVSSAVEVLDSGETLAPAIWKSHSEAAFSPAVEVSSTINAANEPSEPNTLSANDHETINNEQGRDQVVSDPVTEVQDAQKNVDNDHVEQAEDEDEILVAPQRQDTESGLRRL